MAGCGGGGSGGSGGDNNQVSETDTTPPSIPQNLTTTVSDTQIYLSWDASTDDVGVAGYNIYRDGTQIVSTIAPSYSDTGLSPDTTYAYTVSAYDAAGNESSESEGVSGTTEALISTTYYMANNPGPGGEWGDGSDSNDGLSKANPFLTLQYAMSRMQGGDTLIIADGEYAGLNNRIWQFDYPPSGTQDAFTVIRAENIPGLNGVPVDQPLKVKFSGDAVFSVQGPGSGTSSYVKFWGIRWNGISTYTGWDHLYFKQVASQGVEDGNTATIGISGQYNLLEDVVAFGKGRYKILFYDTSRELQTNGPGNNIARRCVVRHDWAMRDDLDQEPIAGISSYFNRGTTLLNCIVIDSDTPSEWNNDPTEIAAAYAQVVDEGPHGLILKGSMAVNVAMAGYNNRQGSSGHQISDFVAIKTAGGLSLQGETNVDRVTLVDLGTDNFTYRSDTQKAKVSAPDDGVFSFREDMVKTFNNSIIRDTLGDGVDDDAIGGTVSDYINMYQIGGTEYVNSTEAPNIYRDDPLLNGLKYPIRVEEGSVLAARGASGGQIGARIVNKLGKDGTFKGDPDWDTEQGPLWPWPLEGWIKAEMSAMDAEINGDIMPDPKRGFCADGKQLNGVDDITLTSYIWEYLGNPMPDGIYSSTYYIATDGVDGAERAGDIDQPFATFAYAFTRMQGGDTLYVMDGTYYESVSGIPSGTPGNYTKIYAVNDFQAEINGDIDGDGRGDIPISNYQNLFDIDNRSYIEVRGLKIHHSKDRNNVLSIYRSNNIIVRKCAVYQSGWNPISSSTNGGYIHDHPLQVSGESDDYSENILIEECMFFGNGRYPVSLGGYSRNSVFRRNVVRFDSGWDNDDVEPIAGMNIYKGVNWIVENNIVLDCYNPEFASSGGDAAIEIGSWNQSYPESTGSKLFGNIIVNLPGPTSLNQAWAGFRASTKRDEDPDNNEIINNVIVGVGSTGMGIVHSRGISYVYRNNTVVFGENASDGYDQTGANDSADTIWENNLALSIPNGNGFKLNSGTYSEFSHNGYFDVSSGVVGFVSSAGERSDDPGVLYPVRLEDDSSYKGAGKDGADIGATVIYRYEDGILTDDPLWPFPNEDQIKDIMNDSAFLAEIGRTGKDAPKWATTDKTLTEYIWEYLGNPIPPEIYGTSAFSITTTSLSAAAAGEAYSQTLQASGGTEPYTWGLFSGSLPDGVFLLADGTLSGTPTTEGTSAFTVQVADGDANTATRELSLTVEP